jgi:hypothetical protein
MTGGGVPEPLFDTTSLSVESDVFCITPGWFGLFSAFGFKSVKVQLEPGKPKGRQAACLSQVLTRTVIVPEELPCGVVREVGSDRRVEIIAEGPVTANGCMWSLSACETMKILDVPGLYRLTLNDKAATATVQVYVRYYPLDRLSRDPALYFGG